MFPPTPEALMPLTTSERRAIWFARQHYFNELMSIIDTEPETLTPPTFVALFHSALTTIRDRIAAEDPQSIDATLTESPAPCPPSPTTNPPAAPSSFSSETPAPARQAL